MKYLSNKPHNSSTISGYTNKVWKECLNLLKIRFSQQEEYINTLTI